MHTIFLNLKCEGKLKGPDWIKLAGLSKAKLGKKRRGSEQGFTVKKSKKSSTNLQMTLFAALDIFPFQKTKSKLSLFSSSGSDIFYSRTD